MDQQGISIDAPSPFSTTAYRGAQTPSYQPTRTSHIRRGSVVDAAAEMMMGDAAPMWLDKLRNVTSKIEDVLDSYSRPLRPWLPGLGRFLIVVTFLEDAIRIMTQSRG